MGHSVGDAAARSVKKSEKQAEKANRTPEQRVGDIRKLAEAGLAVHTADVMFLLSQYDSAAASSVEHGSIFPSDAAVTEAVPPEPYIPETLQE